MEDQKKKQLALVDRYVQVWNEPDSEKKKIALAQIWSPEGVYIDPRANLKGIDELVNHIDKIQSGRPGSKIFRTSDLDIHHHIGRFKWQLEQADKTRLPEGLDIIYFTPDGDKIEKIIGFFGELTSIPS